VLSPAEILAQFKWLQVNPEFNECPATMDQFLGPDYLNLNVPGKPPGVRESVRAVLIEIFGDHVDPYAISIKRRAMFTGAIGIGKTTLASIAIPYMIHWVYCLKSPQEYFGLLPGTRIAFMMMSTSESQAKEVLFGDIKARIQHSPWFKANCTFDPLFKVQLRFPKDIWVLPGSSLETAFEGYNILGGMLDEGDSHKSTSDRDYADVGYDTIHSRIASRFIDPVTQDHRGLLIVIGQMKKASGFMAAKKKQLEKDPDASVTSLSIWESLGWDRYLDPATGKRNSFWYDKRRKMVIPPQIVPQVMGTNADMIEIPLAYYADFDNNPSKALRDLAGIPPETDDPFISLVDRIDECVDKWQERYDGAGSPVGTNPVRPQLADWFGCDDRLLRAIHMDIAYSAKGDAAGIAMGHVSHIVTEDDEDKPYIVIDLLMRIKAAPGTEIMISDLRQIIYELRDNRGFKIKKVTMDGFESTDTMQQLRKKRFIVDYLSTDRSKLPYEDLRDAIYEHRLEFPKYMTYLKKGDTELVEIAKKELTELTDTGKKIDHPSSGSKDLADGLAGVVNTLMGDMKFRRGRFRNSNGSHIKPEEPDDYIKARQSPGFGMIDPNKPMSLEQYKNLMPTGTAPIPPTSPYEGFNSQPNPFGETWR
jgi:hypothetical protein